MFDLTKQVSLVHDKCHASFGDNSSLKKWISA